MVYLSFFGLFSLKVFKIYSVNKILPQTKVSSFHQFLNVISFVFIEMKFSFFSIKTYELLTNFVFDKTTQAELSSAQLNSSRLNSFQFN